MPRAGIRRGIFFSGTGILPVRFGSHGRDTRSLH